MHIIIVLVVMFVAAIFSVLSTATEENLIGVDIELVLAVDNSRSMKPDERKLQRQGYVEALKSKEFIEAVGDRRVAITYLEWGSKDNWSFTVPWFVIQDRTTAFQFASRIEEGWEVDRGNTSISNAIRQSISSIITNRYDGYKKIIDVSGDGVNNDDGSLTLPQVRLLARSYGIVINGLPILLLSKDDILETITETYFFYKNRVIIGPGSFIVPVYYKENLKEAILKKLVREVASR